jgi:hypothetical protein
LENEYPKISITLSIEGQEFDFGSINSTLGVSPTSIRTANDWPDALKNQASALPDELKPRDTWEFKLEKAYCLAVSQRFEELLRLFAGKASSIRELCQQHNFWAAITVVIDMKDDDKPEIVLTPEISSFASQIGAEIGIEIYSEDDFDKMRAELEELRAYKAGKELAFRKEAKLKN